MFTNSKKRIENEPIARKNKNGNKNRKRIKLLEQATANIEFAFAD